MTGTVHGDLTLRVEIDYLTDLMQPPREAIDVTLVRCTSFEYTRWDDDSRTSDVQAFAALEPEILSGSVKGDRVQVICGDGMFDVRYRDVRVARAGGTSTSIDEIQEVAARYWNAFGAERDA